MRNKRSYRVVLAPDVIVGHFGRVRLIRKGDGTHVLNGGTLDQRDAVRQWCEQFASFVAFARVSAEEMALTA